VSLTATKSATYTDVDIERVVTRVRADLMMIADSTGGWTPDKARDYAHDIEELAKAGYLSHVKVFLYDGGEKIRAARFTINTDASTWTSARPGGVCWPRVPDPDLRIYLHYTDDYTAAARSKMASRLKIAWSPTSDDTSFTGMSSSGGRDYASNSYGIARTDWAA